MVGTRAGPSDSGAGNGDLRQHALELGAVTVMAGCQDEGEGAASPLGDEVDLGGEAAAGTSQTLADLATSSSRTASFRSTGSTWFVPRPAPFSGTAAAGAFLSPAACWWARTAVESTETSQSIPPAASSAAWMRDSSIFQVPSADQRRCRL